MSAKTIMCKKLQQQLPALEKAPYPGELGQKIVSHISQKAWDMWLAQQTMLINEYRLSLIDPSARSFLQEEMLRYLFNDEDTTPPAHTEVTD